MTIKLFLKHLLTSIRRRPIQPILLIFVIMLAVSSCIAAIDVDTYLTENDEKKQRAMYGRSDYVISVNSLSATRFILADTKGFLPEGVDMCGVYGLPLLFGENNDFVYGAATDFQMVSRLFDIDFCEYTTISQKEQTNAIFVTKNFAEEHGIDLGKELTFTLLGEKFLFKVYGISDKDFMGSFTVLFDVSSILKMFVSDSLSMKILGDEFIPAGTLYIRTNGKTDGETLRTLFPDMTVASVETLSQNTLTALEIISIVIQLSSLLFAVIIIYCCFHILSEKRRQETQLFYNVGSKKYMLNLFSSLEMFIYWIIGGLFGVLFSIPVDNYFVQAGDLVYCTVQMQPKAILLSLLFVLLASQASLILFLIADEWQKKRKRKSEFSYGLEKKELIPALAVTVVALSSAGACFLVPVTAKASIGLASLLLMAFSSFLWGRVGVKVLSKLLSRSKKLPASLLYGVKNMGQIKTLGNSAGLVGLFCYVAVLLTLLLNTAQLGIIGQEGFLTGDFLVINAGEEAKNILQNTEGVERVDSFYRDNVTIYGDDLFLFSFSDRSAVYPLFPSEDLPQKNEAYLNWAIAEKHGLEIGNEISFFIGGKEIKVVYAKGIECTDTCIIIDADYWGIPMNYYAVKGTEGTDTEVLFERIMTNLMGQSATVVRTKQFFQTWTETVKSYILCAELISFFIILFSLIGMNDSLISGYRSRREEFSFYRAGGMNKKGMRKMIGAELLLSFSVGFLAFLCFAFLLVIVTNQSFLSYGMSIFWLWRQQGIL